MYEWCGRSSYFSSGYRERTDEFSNLTIPVFFSEYGCNTIQPREFTDVETLYSSYMTGVWSGGIVYMYFEEDNNYGLVKVEDDKVKTLKDFDNLKKQMGGISPKIAKVSEVHSDAVLACPATYANWAAATVLPPTPNQNVCDCIQSSAKCVVSKSVKEKDYGELFGIICGSIDCSDISADGESGVYGALSFCSPKEKLNYILNKYYKDNDEHSSACNFKGSATVVHPLSPATCSAVLRNIGTSTSSPMKNVKNNARAIFKYDFPWLPLLCSLFFTVSFALFI
ncbi:unnamed protein product [Ambrosiozyma monospora]|uniref:Unnamed protein product n=1 Tax=Ambrosiozyma monospora TaxID=43982 RepID=A0ACB5T247_AMBMO|nr:unnamed protein product [Ambrosiozyma monospora]